MLRKVGKRDTRLIAKLVTGKKAPCAFCQREVDDEVTYGKLYAIGDIQCHYFCALLSCCLIQKGSDDDGLFGFMYTDILAEVERCRKHRCSYCGKSGANLGCSVAVCRKQFHLPCGRNKNAVSLYFGTYKTFCQQHAPRQKIPEHIMNNARMRRRGVWKMVKNDKDSDIGGESSEATVCVICYEAVDGFPGVNTFWPPCCARDAWFHRTCLQRMALSAGMHYLKCPLCNDKEHFYDAVVNQGYYVPDRDAAWELEQNAFAEIYERAAACSADLCHCQQGREHDAENGDWDIKLCLLCGSTGIHAYCLNSEQSTKHNNQLAAAQLPVDQSQTSDSNNQSVTDQPQDQSERSETTNNQSERSQIDINKSESSPNKKDQSELVSSRFICQTCKPAAPEDLQSLAANIEAIIQREQAQSAAVARRGPIMPSRMSLRRTKGLVYKPSTSRCNTPNATDAYSDSTRSSRQELNLPVRILNKLPNLTPTPHYTENRSGNLKHIINTIWSPTKILEQRLRERLTCVDLKRILDDEEVDAMRDEFRKPRPLSKKEKIVNDLIDGLLNKINRNVKQKSLLKEWLSPKKFCDIPEETITELGMVTDDVLKATNEDNIYVERTSEETAIEDSTEVKIRNNDVVLKTGQVKEKLCSISNTEGYDEFRNNVDGKAHEENMETIQDPTFNCLTGTKDFVGRFANSNSVNEVKSQLNDTVDTTNAETTEDQREKCPNDSEKAIEFENRSDTSIDNKVVKFFDEITAEIALKTASNIIESKKDIKIFDNETNHNLIEYSEKDNSVMELEFTPKTKEDLSLERRKHLINKCGPSKQQKERSRKVKKASRKRGFNRKCSRKHKSKVSERKRGEKQNTCTVNQNNDEIEITEVAEIQYLDVIQNDESSNSTFQLPSEFIADYNSDDDFIFTDTPKHKTVDIKQDSSLEISKKDHSINIDVIHIDEPKSDETDDKKPTFIFSPLDVDKLEEKAMDIALEKFKKEYLNEVDRQFHCQFSHRHEDMNSRNETKIKSAIDFAVEAVIKKQKFENSRKRKVSEGDIVFHYGSSSKKRKMSEGDLTKLNNVQNVEKEAQNKRNKVKKNKIRNKKSKNNERKYKNKKRRDIRKNIDMTINSVKRNNKQKNFKRERKTELSIANNDIKVKIRWKKKQLRLEITESKQMAVKEKENYSKFKQYVLQCPLGGSKEVIVKPAKEVALPKRKYVKTQKTPDKLKQMTIQNFFKAKSIDS